MVAINSSMGAIYFGYVMTVLNTMTDKLTAHMGWVGPDGNEDNKNLYISVATSLVPALAMFGALFGGVMAKWGRKTALLSTDLIGIIGVAICLLSLYQKDEIILFVGRGVSGFAVGLNSMLVPLYIKEVSPVVISGKTGSYN